jgi:hypothetical protein
MSTPATPPQPAQNPTMPQTASTTTPPASWTQASADASAPITPGSGTGSGAGSASPATAPPKNATAQPVPAPPPTAQPVRPGGLRGFVDKMLDAMAGTDTSRVRKDPDGTLYLQHDTPTRGQQWLRIAVEGLRGAAAGMAAGKGAGNQAKALEAGIESQDKVQGQKEEDYKNQQLAVANSQALKHQLAANAFAMTRLQVKAAQEDMDHSEKRADWLKSNGGIAVGHVTQLTDLTKLMRDTPGFHEDQAKNDLFVPVQQYKEDGTANGFEIYKMPEGYGEETTPPGTVFHVFNPLLNDAKGGLQEEKTTEWTPKSKINAYEMAAGTEAQEFALKAAETANKGADTNLKGAQATEARASASTKPSESAKNYAEAALDQTKAEQVKAGQMLADGTPNPRFDQMAQEIVDGNILPKDLKRQAKGMGLDPNQLLERAFELGHAQGKELSLPILEQQDKFAASPKTQAALDGIDRVIGAPGVPGYMDQMLNTAREAHLAAGPAAGAWNSLSLGVKRYLGDAAAKNLETSIAETRRSIAGLIGNPLLGGSETDKRLEQAEEMLGKSPTTENLQSASQILKTALQSQRASIVGNNIYLSKRYGGATRQPQQPAQPQQFSAYSSDGKWGWNGSAWVGTGK